MNNCGFLLGWLDLLAPWLQVLLITLKHSAIADLHTFQFTVAHALEFSVFTSRFLAMDLNPVTSISNHYKVFLPFLVQSQWNLGTQLKTLLDSSVVIIKISSYTLKITITIALKVFNVCEYFTAESSLLLSVTASCPWLRLLSHDWLQTTFTVPYKTSPRTPQKTPIIIDMFTVLLLSTGPGADHIENKSRDSYLASVCVCGCVLKYNIVK
jgi:hypothetical protein